MRITLPIVLWLDESCAGNVIRQIRKSSHQLAGVLAHFSRGKLKGFLFHEYDSGNETLIVPKARKLPKNHSSVIEAEIADPNGNIDIREGMWIKHPLLTGAAFDYEEEIRRVLESWTGAFSYIEEDAEKGIKGLRGPQIGAVHATHAHWSVSDAPATIVMPTGTGKTETMLSVLVSARCSRLLVVVPTDVLRTQIADKFMTLGVLKEPGCSVLSSSAKYPIVGVLLHIPKRMEDVDELFSRCNVIVTTSSIAGRCKREIQYRMAEHCPYLFIDEAHHTEAPTWKTFKERFQKRRIVQFTATPFREDGKPIDGKIIYKYPLEKAQQEGYFKRIRFCPVVEFNPGRSDAAIAAKAVAQLRADEAKGHIVMARVGSVARAKEVFQIYKRYEEFNPVELHTGIKPASVREAARKQIISSTARIVVCVDMLGEGFDLPELKIAAFHDIRKSLPVTLQLAGRFTRSRPDLGDATFIANIADIQVQEELRKLYTRDPDWNVLLPELSDKVIGEQVSLQEFLEGFTDFTNEIPLKTVRPAISTVVYQTKCAKWNPENFKSGIPAIGGCARIHNTINEREHTLVIITARRISLDWTDIENLFSWQWDLYVVIWSPDQNLLFINASTNTGEYKALAEAIAGREVTLIEGQQVFRAFAGVNRLRLKNVGLTEQRGRNIRYTGRMGADVEAGIPDPQRQRARKSVLSGNGFEGGERVTVGASRKGRIWSHQRDRIDKLAAWCKKLGAKLLNEDIDPDDVLKGTLNTKTIKERPAEIPIAVDWPEEMYKTQEVKWSVIIDDQEQPLSHLEISLVDSAPDGALTFAIASESARVDVELELFEENESSDYRFIVLGDQTTMMQCGQRQTSLTDFFYNDPPIIWFADGSSLEGNQHVELKKTVSVYDCKKIHAWDWVGVDIKKESQGETKDQKSIQARVIRELKRYDYVMIVDDDGKGEAADVVAIRLVGNQSSPDSIDVEFYHCKYSQEAVPGRRIKDLYEVCGQAHKSVLWMSSSEKQTDLFTHFLRREAMRNERGGVSRYEVGNEETLQKIREMSRTCQVNFKIFIVQPGVSKGKVSQEQLLLMGVTETYLLETYRLPFNVIASA